MGKGSEIGRSRRAYALGAVIVAALACVGATTAGVPGRWDVVVQGAEVPGNSASELGLARAAGGVLHVAWKERTGPLTEAIRHRTVSPAGRVGPVSTIASGWASLSDPELVVAAGRVRAYFGGQRTTDPTDPLTGLLWASAPVSGGPWTPPAVIHARNNTGGARNPSVAVGRDGTDYQAWYGASEIYVHRGLDPAAPDHLFTASPALTEFGPTVVADAAGRVWVSWCGFGGSGGGLFVQRADPASGAPIGAPRKLPGSTTPYGGTQHSTCNLERTAARRTPMVARAGGGVFVAGSAGYPALSRVHVWRIDPSGQIPAGSFVVASAAAFGHATPMLAAAPDGRVWVAWLETRPGRPVIAARRSNRLGTAWGEPVRVSAPGRWLPGALNISAQRGRLDVLGLMGSVGAADSVQHTQLLPGLTLKRTGTTRRPDGSVVVRFRVEDAGDPVAGASVRIPGSLSTTEATAGDGVAVVWLPAGTARTVRATAAKAGYVPHTIGFRCC
ncbi:MAG: hypothetical protein K0T00_1674 [Gaiellaceae bacterium]|nr:hypothetical protein [Gaiellaceae bacterium]